MQQQSVRFTVVSAGAKAANPSVLDYASGLTLGDSNWCDEVLGFVDRHRKWLWLTVLVMYLAAFNGQWRIQSDAALYLSLGRNLAHGHGFTYLGQPEHTAYPGWPALIAVTFKMFGSNSLLPVNVLMLLISLATVGVVYRLFLIHSGRPTAVAVSVGVGLTKAFFCYAFELWSDMPFALGVMCVLAGFEGLGANHYRSVENRRPRGKLFLDAMFLIGGTALAASTRPTFWPLLAAMLLAMTWRAFRRRAWKWAVPAVIIGAIGVTGICYMFGWAHGGIPGFGGAYEQYLFNRFAGRDVGGATHSLWQNVCDLFSWAASDVLFQTRLGPFFNALLSMLVLGLGFSLFRYRSLWGIWFCFLLGTILISQETLDRYFLPVLPLLVYAWWDLLVQLNRKLPRQWTNFVFLGLLGFGSLMNFTKCCGIIMQQRQRPFLASFNQGTYDGVPEFARQLQNHVGDRAVILCKAPYGRVTAYLSERFVIGSMGVTMNQLKNSPIYVIEPSDIGTRTLLKAEGLEEGPAIFTVHPSPEHGPLATVLSLHATHRK